jgi:enolase-phosphatase E1
MRYILTDIEGTTSSVSFVYDGLYPYFMQNIRSFLAIHSSRTDLLGPVADVRDTVLREEAKLIPQEDVASTLIEWTENDRKHGALKAIQGAVWRLAYEKGEIRGHIYEDVPPALERWKQSGLSMGVYSSGSVEAQKLIFAFSVLGDLEHFFSDHFDTGTGPKREAPSYSKIRQKLGIPADEILFLSDTEAELDAAGKAGFFTTQLVREGTRPGKRHRVAHDFSEIQLSDYD